MGPGRKIHNFHPAWTLPATFSRDCLKVGSMNETFTIKKRVQSIDLLRGLAIIVMALDHTRNYFNADAMLFAPLDLAQTNVPLFFTRWITHFCAPVFMFLADTSAFMIQQRKTKKELSFFLVT